MLKCKILLDFGNPDYVVGEVYDMPEADATQLVRWGIVEILADPPAPPDTTTAKTTTTTAKPATEPADTTTAKTTTTTAK